MKNIFIRLSDEKEVICYIPLNKPIFIYIDEAGDLCIQIGENTEEFSYSSKRKALKDYDKLYKLIFDCEIERKKTIKEMVDEEMAEFESEDEDE